ncbi:hypothetical protein GCM10022419_131140 [Nonomuraea rosea]|uniref:Integrase catalytic domain-containing protein n=1 Tax=Nonomuraea rosea TaxID=638574 RepID=A0ABP7A1T0_9ACTN
MSWPLSHLEGDLIIGAKNSQVATLVDRKSRYLTMVALPSRHTTTVIPALQQAFARMDARLRSTLTWDRGMELAGHQLLTEATGIDVFFAAPRSPWQRGTNEKHQQTDPAIPTERHRSEPVQPSRPRHPGRPTEQPPPQVPRLPNPGPMCCLDSLNLRPADIPVTATQTIGTTHTQLAPHPAQRPQLADPRLRAHTLVESMVANAPAL